MNLRFAPLNPDPRRLEPYGAPVVLLSADLMMLELVDLAFAEHAPLSWATTEQQLIDLLLAEPVAGVVLDATIAEPVACCLRLRLASLAPIIVIAADDDSDTQVRLLRSGADDVLTRPCWPTELRARVEAKLRRAGRKSA